MGSVAADVEFDWSGSLRMARELWALADSLLAEMTARETKGADASVDWQGPHHDTFVSYLGVERTNIEGVATQLRNAADGWAFQWQQAMDQQNQVLMAREWDGREGDLLNKATFGLFGSGPKKPPDPTPTQLPSAPDFLPTRGFYTASNP